MIMEDLLLAILVALALAAVRQRDLFASTAILGAYSLLMAVLWSTMNALDVGFTEAAVYGLAAFVLGELFVIGFLVWRVQH